jgi:hypothetical protein
MSRLHDQHRRLYGTADDTDDPGLVRTLVIGLAKPADWAVLSTVWRGVQADLDLPAPGIVVNGVDGIELWFSLAEPQALPQLAAFAAALVRRYLPDVKPERVRCWPAAPSSVAVTTPPPLAPRPTGPERWAAFVAPDLAAVFADDPALDMPPGDDAQADLLSRLVSIPAAAFRAALVDLSGELATDEAPAADLQGRAAPPVQGQAGPAPSGVALSLSGPFEDPGTFLRAVMNEPTVPLGQRIDAARALLAAAGSTGR